MITKQELRKTVAGLYASLDEEYIMFSDAAIIEHVLSSSRYIEAETILVYASMDREIKTGHLIESALKSGKTVCLPRSEPNGVMNACVITDYADLSPGLYSIPAPPENAAVIPPEDLDLIIVPALSFDRSGNRLGHGGGYYDRYLKRTSAYTMGLMREKLLQDHIPHDSLDVSVRAIVTETGIRQFV